MTRHAASILARSALALSIASLTAGTAVAQSDSPADAYATHRVSRVDSGPVVGQVRGIDADWKVRIMQSAVKEVRLNADGIETITRVDLPTKAGDLAGLQIVFPNGDHLAAKELTADDETIRASHPFFGELRVPITYVAGIVFAQGLPADEIPKLIEQVAGLRINEDRVIFLNSDSRGGTFLGLDQENVTLTGERAETNVQRKRIKALVFNRNLNIFETPAKDMYAGLLLRDGSRLSAGKLQLAHGQLAIETLFETKLKTSFVHVRNISFHNGRLVYISDIEPAKYEHTPYLSLRWPLGRDRTVGGNRLRLRNHVYRKGLGMHSHGRVTYDLAGRFKGFKSLVGVDDEAAGRGSVVFRVWLDGKKAYQSPVLTGSGTAESIDLDLAGAKVMVLEVDFADGGDVADRATWADARLIR